MMGLIFARRLNVLTNNSMEKQLKATLIGLRKADLIYSELWTELVKKLIDLLELEERFEAVDYWKKQL